MKRRIMVRAASPESSKVFLEMPEYYKFGETWNKVVSGNCVVSVLKDARNLVIEDSITKTEQTKAVEITEEEFNSMFNKHFEFLNKIKNGNN